MSINHKVKLLYKKRFENEDLVDCNSCRSCVYITKYSTYTNSYIIL